MLQRREIVFDIGEGFGRGEERHFGAALAVGIAHDFQRRDRVAVLELDVVFLAVAPDAQFQSARQCVDHRDADAVETAGDLVGILVEFSAGMKLGHDDLGRRNAFALVNANRNAAAVVAYGDRIVGIENHLDARGVTCEGFVDGVIDDFVDHVMQARAVIGIADIHAGAFADGVETFQHPDRFSAVFRSRIGDRFGAGLPGWFGHELPSRWIESGRRKCALECQFVP